MISLYLDLWRCKKIWKVDIIIWQVDITSDKSPLNCRKTRLCNQSQLVRELCRLVRELCWLVRSNWQLWGITTLKKLDIKDEWHPTYVIMMCKRWTSMNSTNFLRNASANFKKKSITFFPFVINEHQY